MAAHVSIYIYIFWQKEHQLISLDKRKRVQIEKGEKPKTFSKGDVSKCGHSQPILNVLSPNKVRDNIKPK